MDDDALRARLERLEERLAVLETRLSPAGEPAAAIDIDQDARFWALAGLRARVSDDGAVLFTGSVRLPTGEEAQWQQGATTESLLESDWRLVSDAIAALGHPVRLSLLRAILGGVRTVAELNEIPELGTSGQLYHHLRHLVAAGWLRSTGRGRYEMPAARVVPVLAIITAAHR